MEGRRGLRGLRAAVRRALYGKRGPWPLAAALLAGALSARVVFCRYTFARKTEHAAILACLSGLLVAARFTGDPRYVHAWMYKNVVAYNLEVASESRGYSEGFVARGAFEPAVTLKPKKVEQPDVIVLQVESLSSYQSRFFSGLCDWTPNLDRIARENAAYPGFYANGFCTNDCYIAVLTGEPPIRPPGEKARRRGGEYVGAFEGFEDPVESLPRLLSRRGYATEFLMSADLSFAGVGRWAEGIGFDTVEGHTHPAYAGCVRWQFDAAPDEALYRRVCDRVREHEGRRFFMYVSTISSHHPYVNPETGERSEEQTIRYVDRQLGRFYDRLAEMGFFENGVLIIFGDHHAMVPSRPGELETFGEDRAAAKVPLVVAYRAMRRGTYEGLFQQTDIFNSLKNLTSDRYSTSDWAGDIFSGTPAKYVLFRRGDYRHIVSVFTDAGSYRVRLDGDDTRLIGPADLDESTRRAIVDRINSVRMGCDAQHAPATHRPADASR